MGYVPSQIPTLKFLTPPSTLKSHPLGHDPGYIVKILFDYVSYLLFLRIQPMLGINIIEIDIVMKFTDIWPFDLTPRIPV